MRVQDLLNTLVDRDARTNGKNQDGDNKCPEIEFSSVAERMLFVGGFLRTFQAMEKKNLITGVDQGMNAFRQHGR